MYLILPCVMSLKLLSWKAREFATELWPASTAWSEYIWIPLLFRRKKKRENRAVSEFHLLDFYFFILLYIYCPSCTRNWNQIKEKKYCSGILVYLHGRWPWETGSQCRVLHWIDVLKLYQPLGFTGSRTLLVPNSHRCKQLPHRLSRSLSRTFKTSTLKRWNTKKAVGQKPGWTINGELGYASMEKERNRDVPPVPKSHLR